MKRISSLLLLMLVVLNVHCQVPFRINYQAAIRNNNAPVISTKIGLKISILRSSASGTIVYAETQTPLTDANGILSTEIGSGSAITGQIASIDWSSGPYFIKIETDPAGGNNYTVLGTSQLLSVPYAFYAKTAENGFPATDKTKLAGIAEGAEVNVNADWNAVSGDALIMNKPVVDGSETKINAGTNISISGSGTASSPYVINTEVPVPAGKVKGDIQYWNGSKWILLTRGNFGQILTINNDGLPSWQSISSIPTIVEKSKYLKTSYDLSNFTDWIDLHQVYKTVGENVALNLFLTTEICQLDYNGDGLEDIFSANPDSILNPIHPQVLFKNMGDGTYLQQDTKLPETTGCKVLVGDYNNDSRPDIFSLSAVDLAGGAPAILTNNLLLNDGNGNFTKVEIPGLGFWNSGASGDIDRDGDLDIVVFNFHTGMTGIKSRILWNDGEGNFSVDENGIGNLYDPPVDNCELYDLNLDGFLDLIVNRPTMPNGYGKNDTEVLWGDGKGYSELNRTIVPNSNPNPMQDIDFVDSDGDNIMELIFIYNPNSGIWEVNMHKTDDKGLTYKDVTNTYIPDNKRHTGDGIIRFLRVQDIDQNSRMDIFSTGKMENIRWEQDTNGVFRRK